MHNICRKEIEQLHVFIEAWLNGEAEKARPVFQKFEESFEADFLIIHPSGQAQGKAEIVADIWDAYGKHPKRFSIEIKNISLCYNAGPICLVT